MDNYRTVATTSVSVASIFMRQVYQWMTAGLGVTAATALLVAGSEAMRTAIFGSSLVLIALIIAQIGLVIALSAAVQRMSAATATGLFLLYSAVTGVTMASVFIVYPVGSIVNAFAAAAGTFLAMSVYGHVTKRDLTSLGSFMFMGLIGMVIAMLVNLFLKSSMMDFVISCIGVLVFTGLTAYDSQKIKEFGAAAPLDDATAVRRGVILGALTLYLDFINLFLMLLRLLGGNRE